MQFFNQVTYNTESNLTDEILSHNSSYNTLTLLYGWDNHWSPFPNTADRSSKDTEGKCETGAQKPRMLFLI